MNRKKILFWDRSVSDMLQERQFGGIAVQLNFWMQIFSDHGWEIHALTYSDSYVEKNVVYHHISHYQSIELALEWVSIFNIIKKIRPQLVVFRGARRLLYPLQKISHHFGAKVIMQGASDVNFVPGKASVGNNINRWMYEAALRKIDFIICQNEYQSTTLKNNFGRSSLIIPNIWGRMPMSAKTDLSCAEVVWIGNFRSLKRPEWLIEVSRRLPNVKFAMAGGPTVPDYYSKIEKEAATIPNLDFLGLISIEESNALISRAKVLVCTSEYEGFPNTFLQAWSKGVPVVSTVDPNHVIDTYNLGFVIDSPATLSNAISRLLNDSELYHSKQRAISDYFVSHHSSKKCFDDLIEYISLK